MYKKLGKKPNVLNTYYVQVTVLGTSSPIYRTSWSCNKTQVVLWPSSDGKTGFEVNRSRSQRWLGGESSLRPGMSGVSQLPFQVSRESDWIIWFLLVTHCRDNELQMLLCVWRGSRALSRLLVSGDSPPSSSVVQRVNLNPPKCQAPHLLLHLKWEYFALFFFFFFKSRFGLSVFCAAAFSPDANNEETVLSDKGEISEIKMSERGRLAMGTTKNEVLLWYPVQVWWGTTVCP